MLVVLPFNRNERADKMRSRDVIVDRNSRVVIKAHVVKLCSSVQFFNMSLRRTRFRRYFGFENASHRPPPTMKLPLIRDRSLMRLADSMRPARPAASA